MVFEGRVPAVGVVVGFDVGEDFRAGVGRIDEASVLKHFGLESADK